MTCFDSILTLKENSRHGSVVDSVYCIRHQKTLLGCLLNATKEGSSFVAERMALSSTIRKAVGDFQNYSGVQLERIRTLSQQ